jgi:predicted AAA+ superfamily ATPase
VIRRQIETLVRERLEASPAVALVGPRQCGKTTLARTFGGVSYDLEQEPDRLRLDLEWDRRVAASELVVLDEAQAWPPIFPRLRAAIDADRSRKGRFLLLGSVSPALMVHVSESLAGRLALVELTPFLLQELGAQAQRDRLWLHGGYPDGGVLDPKQYPRWEIDYLALLTQRDLPNWGLSAHPATTGRLIRMLAAAHGQVWNASKLAQSLGLSYHTVNGYLDWLVGAFLVRRLQPYHANIGKRLVKSPKVYWRDSGLLHALMNVADDHDLLAQPWVGASWESFVIEQALGTLATTGVPFDAWYFRTSDQHELDLVVDFGRQRWAVEIKLTSAPGPEDFARLDQAADWVEASRRFLVSRTTKDAGTRTRLSCNLESFLAECAERRRPR